MMFCICYGFPGHLVNNFLHRVYMLIFKVYSLGGIRSVQEI